MEWTGWALLLCCWPLTLCLGDNVTLFNWQPICEGDEATCGWPAGKSMRLGAEIMVERINRGGFLRGGHVLSLEVVDTHCSASHGLEQAASLLMLPRDSWPFGVVGCGCSSCSFSAAPILSLARVPLISQSASSVGLSDRQKFPHFFRTQPPDQPLVKAFLRLYSKVFGWRKLAMLMSVALQESWSDWWEVQVKHFNVTDVLMGSPFRAMRDATPEAAGKALDEVVLEKVRGVVMITFAPENRQVACQIAKKGIRGLVVTHFGWFSPTWITDSLAETGCTVSEMRRATELYISAIAVPWNDFGSLVPCDTSGNFSVGDFAAEYHARRAALGLEARAETGQNADAVCMMARLFNMLMDEGRNFSEVHNMDSAVFSRSMELFQRESFSGVSGPVSFPADASLDGSGDRLGTSELFQLVTGSLRRIGVVTDSDIQFISSDALTFDQGYTQARPPPAEFPACNEGGQIYDFASSACVGCAANKDYIQAAGKCLAVAGFFEGGDGSAVSCVSGSFSSNAGAESCALCDLGSFSNAGAKECSFCPRGTFAERVGSPSCTNCSARFPGTTSRNIASVSAAACICDLGSYSSGGGCQRCPAGSSTPDAGSSSVEACLCEEGTYMPMDRSRCLPCPRGMSCALGSSAANFATGGTTPVLLPGFYSGPTHGVLSVFQCREDRQCVGGDPGPGTCAAFLTGTNCDHCVEGRHWNGEQCQECVGVPLFPWLPCLLVPPITVLLYALKVKEIAATQWSNVGNCRNALLFILLNHYQVLSLTRGAILAMPSRLVILINFWAWTTDASSIFDLACTGYRRFQPSTVMRTLVPLVVSLLMAGTWAGSLLLARAFQMPNLSLSADRLLNVWGTTMFSFFTAIGAVSLLLLKCTSNPNGRLTLASDRSIICYDTDEWWSMLGVAIAAVLVYIGGMGALFTRTVIRAPIPGCFDDPHYQTRWAFLFIRYRPEAYWFAIVFLAKNFLVNVGYVLFSDSVWQLNWCFTVIVVYTAMVVLYAPYRSQLVWQVELLISMSLFHMTPMLTWFATHGDNGTEFDKVVGNSIAFWSFLPLCVGFLTGVCLSVHATVYFQRIREQQDLDFLKVHEACKFLSSLSVQQGQEFYGKIGDWDRLLLREASRCVKVELLGRHDRWRTSDKKLCQRFSSRLTQFRASRPPQPLLV